VRRRAWRGLRGDSSGACVRPARHDHRGRQRWRGRNPAGQRIVDGLGDELRVEGVRQHFAEGLRRRLLLLVLEWVLRVTAVIASVEVMLMLPEHARPADDAGVAARADIGSPGGRGDLAIVWQADAVPRGQYVGKAAGTAEGRLPKG